MTVKAEWRISVIFILVLAAVGMTHTSKGDTDKELLKRLLEVLKDENHIKRIIDPAQKENAEEPDIDRSVSDLFKLDDLEEGEGLVLEARASSAPGCRGQALAMRSKTGRITTPGYGNSRYPNNAKCRWCIISDDVNAKIKLRFRTPFSIEDGPRCTYDSISVFEKVRGETTRIGRYCNSNAPPVTIQRSTNMMCLEFLSDYSTTGAGFSVDYQIIAGPAAEKQDACTGKKLETIKGSSGTITSQNFPKGYGLDLTCNWLIQVPEGNKIRLDMEDFSLEADVGCSYDYLTVYDGTRANSAAVIGKYCGTKVPADITASGNSVFLTFKSDGSVSKSGFKIRYSTIKVTPSAPRPGQPSPSPTTPAEPQVDLSCSFEEGTMCMWTRAAGGAINWKLKAAKDNTFLISNGQKWGNRDHTIGTNIGHYIVIDGSENIRMANSKGYLVSPTLSAGPAEGRCLTLWYNMYYTKGTLRVMMRRDDEKDEVIWQRDGFQGNGWHKGRISLVSSVSYTIVLVGSRGTKDKETGIAVDDISFESTPCLAIALDCGQRHESVLKRSLLDDLLHPEAKSQKEEDDMTKRILGGQPSELGKWPWIVNIRTTPPGSETFMACGGSLIAPQWILTAAHCFENNGQWLTDPINVQLRLGEANVARSGWEESQINIRPSKVIIHPQRSKESLGQVAPYDLALVKLPHNVTLTNEINVVCLPPAASVFRPGSSCVVTGWGITEEGTVAGSQQLLHVDLELLSSQRCRSYFGSSIGTDVMCAKHQRQIKAACKGDSGGPLVCRSGDHYILAGVVSWGVPCSRHEQPLPSVFAKVTYFLPWIESTINSEQ